MSYLKTLYTVQKAKGDVLCQTSHGSTDAEITVCGIGLNENFVITNNVFDGEITCKKCLKKLREMSKVSLAYASDVRKERKHTINLLRSLAENSWDHFLPEERKTLNDLIRNLESKGG